MLEQIAQVLGRTMERMGPDVKQRIQGQWYEEGVRQDPCIERSFFFEFRPDGLAVDERGYKSPYEIRSGPSLLFFLAELRALSWPVRTDVLSRLLKNGV